MVWSCEKGGRGETTKGKRSDGIPLSERIVAGLRRHETETYFREPWEERSGD